MLLFVNTPLGSGERPLVVTLDVPTVHLLARHQHVALWDGPGKVHWGHRIQGEDPQTICGTAVGGAYVGHVGKVTDITCSKCIEKWWANERLLGSGGAEWIQGPW